MSADFKKQQRHLVTKYRMALSQLIALKRAGKISALLI